MEIQPWFDREDRRKLRACTICKAAADEPCDPKRPSFEHIGRSWSIAITWPGSSFGADEYPSAHTEQCRATIESLHSHDDEPELEEFADGMEASYGHIRYRGACLHCGWAGEKRGYEEHAVADGLDHAFGPAWRDLPATERAPGAGSGADDKKRARFIAEIDMMRRAQGVPDNLLLANGGVLRTMRQSMGTRWYWTGEFYDISAGVEVKEMRKVKPAQQGTLFG